MKKSDLNDFLIRLKKNIEHFKKHGEMNLMAEEFPPTDSPSSDSILSMQSTAARMRANLAITESRNASFFFDYGDLGL